jgi:peptide-methionine (S)-S-oxide reductase
MTADSQKNTSKSETIILGGGCFWCTEAVFKMLKGVVSVTPGYAGGPETAKDVHAPGYEKVSSGTTSYAEVISIEYNPALISLENLLTVFFATHDPTTLNRQGNDIGPQYRSVIFYSSPEQKDTAEKFIDELDASSKEGNPIVTEVTPLGAFFRAEEYHLDYYARNKEAPYCELVINPKLEKVQKKFAEFLKENPY